MEQIRKTKIGFDCRKQECEANKMIGKSASHSSLAITHAGWANANTVRNALFMATTMLVAVLVLYPLGILISISFTPTQSILGAELTPLQSYLFIFDDLDLVKHTLIIAVGSTTLALILGVTMAWIFARAIIPFKGFLEVFVTIPFYLSPLLGALGWVVLAAPGKVGLINIWVMTVFGLSQSPFNIYSPPGIIWVLGIFFTPFAFLIVTAALRSMDPSLEECSRVSGAGRFRTAIAIALPVVKPAILNAGLLIFILSLGNFAVPAIIGMPRGYLVLTTSIYQQVTDIVPNYSCIGRCAAWRPSKYSHGMIGESGFTATSKIVNWPKRTAAF